ncbi:MAG: DUF1186 domain-containing protein [Bacillota bacterium]|nr:DUF1186 domain-containing protein [Bacillota bacterium]
MLELKHLKSLEHIKGGVPLEELNALLENRDKYVDELLEVIDFTVQNAGELALDNSFLLHIIAMHTLAYYREKRAYPGIVAMARLPVKIINPLLEDTITEGLSNIIASVCDGDIEPIKGIIESGECDRFVRRAALASLVALVANDVVGRDEVVSYFKDLFNQKNHLLDEDMLEGLIYESLNIHPLALAEEINTANNGDVLGYYSPDFEDNLAEQTAKSSEDILEKMKMSPDNRFITKEDVLFLAKWLGKTSVGEDFGNFMPIDEYEDADFSHVNTTPIQKKIKVGRNEPCPCGSGKKFKKCCGR